MNFDLRPLGKRVRTSGNRVATCSLLVGVSGPPCMSPPGTKSSDLGMGHPGAAGSGEARS